MPTLRPLATASTLILSSVLTTHAWAGDAHDHDHTPRAHAAHVHGVAEMSLVEDAGTVVLELNAPGMSLAGFEHAPKTDADVGRINAALSLLRAVDSVIRFDGGSCTLVSHNAQSSYPDQPAQDHGHTHDNKHEHEHENDTHNAFSASYQFQCKQPEAITRVQLPILKSFPALETLSVQWIVRGKQGVAQITADDPTLRF